MKRDPKTFWREEIVNLIVGLLILLAFLAMTPIPELVIRYFRER